MEMNISTEDVIIRAIDNLVRDNEYVSEIESNGPGYLFYKEAGKRKNIPLNLKSDEDYNKAIDGLIKKAGFIKNPHLVEGRYLLPGDNFGRLHITMPPTSVVPMMTLAIKTESLTDLTSLQGSGSFNTDISRFLKAAIGAKLTIVVSGGTGAGKTTLLEALTSEFKQEERVGVAEDSPELQLNSPNTAYLNSTVWSPGMDPDEVADLSWIVKQINRMRVDRVIIGETRGKEFFDFITAANSGAEGSLTTLHANDGHSAMKKMATFMYMAVDMSPKIINEMISEAVDVVIQLGRNNLTGAHKVLSISEVTNAISSGDSPTIALNNLFVYDHETDTWEKRFATDSLQRRLKGFGYNPTSYSIEEQEDRSSSSNKLPSYFKGED